LSRQWLEQRERSNAAAIRLLVGVALALGRPVGRALLYPVCAYFLIFSVKAKAASKKYLSKVLGRPPGIADLFRHYYNFATVALDRMFLLRGRFDQFDVRIHGEEILLETLARGETCLLLGAHLGSFEVLRALGRVRRVQVTLAMFEHANPSVNALAKALNPQLEETVIGLGSPQSMLELRQRFERGEWVGMLGDRGLDNSATVQVPFLGEPAPFPVAPFRIAALLGRPVVLMVGLYHGGNRYDLCFERLVDAPKLERATRDATLRRWVELYAQRIEHYCRLAPYNWFNFYDFWADSTASR
jgi:predicted LPLAT superfamily acyltransferase